MQYDRVIRLALLLPIMFETVHGHYGFIRVLCRELGSLQNVEFIYSINYDKKELLRFNSTENKVVAYTEYAMKWADDFNKKPEWLHMEAEKAIADCKRFGQLYLPEVEKTVKPEVTIRSVRQASGNKPAMLICSAYDFYPKPIKLTWLRDDKEVTTDVTSTEELADGDWYYQVHSHLEYYPKPGEKVSCVVEHASSHKPMIYDLDSSLSESDRNKLITGAAGVVLGVIMAAGGLVYYKRKHTALIISAGSQCSEPLQTIRNAEEQ
ncbi:rano class II histocompatibility antigen, A beta chain [Carassius auratus]|uniref:Rano class II histocompatibility antigen, A beta chain n=1 Tax=Carassius auratus TaxID=7957 RepID=A0A6P6PCP4_CARAU|nr:rano class II histocompatibility antigen, A beta chain-like [Carassius auratus]XP_052459972.1 rano class II histocompatibility antigen, A beta chain isoform X1 [Carassius gibelio]